MAIEEPTAEQAKLYMEMVAALMTKLGMDEFEIDLADVPNKPFQLWRKLNDGHLVVRLIWEDPPAPASRS